MSCKGLNVKKEYQNSQTKKSSSFVVVGTLSVFSLLEPWLTDRLGHVDHGKSTLMGRLLYDLKIVNESTMRKYKKESDTIGKGSFHLAWVLDETPDERSRGITVDIATRFFETAKTRFCILDAPGHRDFVPNMIAGAGQADFAVLVIDSSTNSFESGLRGQTKEHALLVRTMGVKRVIVAVNKMDRANWSQERFNEIRTTVTAFLIKATYNPDLISFIPRSEGE